MRPPALHRHAAPLLFTALAGCAWAPALAPMPAAQPASLAACAELATRVALPRLAIASAAVVPAGTLSVAGKPVAEHCLVSGRLNERTSAVDGQTYAIGFQMRLPLAWNGRFFHQGNGGLDGIVAPALGGVGGGGELTSALQMGFAVLSSDAGHGVRQLPLFGRDPEARLDYGYKAVGALTPVARAIITAAYGKAPDRSYFGGCSNGGRHAMVAAARYAADYDGILAGDPGFNLPKAALAQVWGAQQYAALVGNGDLASSITPAERQWVATRILARCDALDGLADGIVGDAAACQAAFDVARDVPQCSGARDGQCLSAGQKAVLARVHAGASTRGGAPVYAPFFFDPGIAGSDWASWKFVSSVTNRDPVALAYVFLTPPADAGGAGSAAADPRSFALNFDIDSGAARIDARDGVYRESAMQFMAPPNADDLSALRARGGRLLAYHGTADPVFSAADTVAWYERLRARHGSGTGDFARLFLVPGMNHCRGGPATDQFDMLSALVAWVEQGQAPERVAASARGPGNAVPNPEVPAAWAPDRSRPLCAFPRVARYKGSGDTERAEHFDCK